MKKIIGFDLVNNGSIVLFLLFIFFSAQPIVAQSGFHKRFVLVEVSNFSKEKILPILIHKAGQTPGFEIVGYCNDQSLVAIQLNSTQYPDDKVIDNFFKELGMVIYIKEDIQENQMDAICHQTYHKIN